MTPISERDRTRTRPVAGALTSPVAILAAGAGAAVALVAAVPLGLPAVIAGLVGAGAGLGAGAAAAGRSAGPGGAGDPARRIDPMAVDEPWRHAVVDALQAKGRFDQAVGSFPDGPLKVSMAGIAADVERALDECWRIAQVGQRASLARSRLYDSEARRDLAQLTSSIGGGEPTPVQAETIASLERQIATADRMESGIADTTSSLDLLNARLDECVSRAIELSLVPGDASGLGRDVDLIVEDLEALRLAFAEVTDGTPSGPTEGGTR